MDKKQTKVLTEAFKRVEIAAVEGASLLRMHGDAGTASRVRHQAEQARAVAAAIVEAIDLAQGASAVLEKAGAG